LVDRNVPIVEIRHRVKHPAGLWKKMRQKNLTFDQVHDLVALRIVVPTEADCYHALGVVHDLYAPIVGRFKDYIVQPKSNGYRSLHASVRDAHRAVFEVQIRSLAMHRHAERGPATHADYKDATRIPADPGRRAPWKRLFRLGRRLRQPRQS
jgi:GTP pyrophosphokinase